MTHHTPLQQALLSQALKRHAHDFGKYVLVNVDTGDSFAAQTSKGAFEKESFWYGPSAFYNEVARHMVGVVIVVPSFHTVEAYLAWQRSQNKTHGACLQT